MKSDGGGGQWRVICLINSYTDASVAHVELL